MARVSLYGVSIYVAVLTCISGSVFAMGSSSNESNASDDYKKAVKAIEGKDFATAETLLVGYVKKKEKDANGWNYLAYAQRNQGKNDEAMTNYNAALQLDPKHKGALEYQGELFLTLGNTEAAKANLAKLDAICAPQCAERDELRAAIERAKDGKAAWIAPQRDAKGRS